MSPTGHGGSAGDDLVVTDVADVADVPRGAPALTRTPSATEMVKDSALGAALLRGSGGVLALT